MKYDVINALANPTRLKILCCLAKGKKNVQELINNCSLAQSAVSQHLTKLKQAGLVNTQKDGKFVYYSLINTKAAKIAQQIQELIKEVQQ